ncbi:6601_t:CDS:2, partial [Gigaspora margarita]
EAKNEQLNPKSSTKQHYEEQTEAHNVDQIWDIIVNSITELEKLQQPILKLAKTKAKLASTMANSILYYPNICNFKNFASEIIIKWISSLNAKLNSAGPEAEILEIQFLQGKALERQINFKPKSIKWKIKGEGPTILELLSPKLNFKAAKTLEKFNIFYTNQFILQNNKTLATWSQLKLIKDATRKGRKPTWFEHLESIVLQDSGIRKIKDDFYTSTDLRSLAIPNLQPLAADKRIKDWKSDKKEDRTNSSQSLWKKQYSAASTYSVVRLILEPILQKHIEAKMQDSYCLGKKHRYRKKAKWKSKSRPIAARSKEMLKKRNKALELERLEGKGAPP